ncbi:MAG: hypothetical protein PVG39_12785 [Desulfobacteraceae bacterium]
MNKSYDFEEEEQREAGKAFIPSANEYIKGIVKVNKDFISFVQKHNRHKTATLDMDATLVETNKSVALIVIKDSNHINR